MPEIAHSSPDSAPLCTMWFRGFPNGRFANAAFQYLFARYLSRTLPCRVLLGERLKPESQLPNLLFNIGNDLIAIEQAHAQCHWAPLVLGENRREGPAADVAAIARHFQTYPGSTLIVDGFFQYDTEFMNADPDYRQAFQDLFGPDVPGGNTFQKILRRNIDTIDTLLNGYLICAHVRRGDYSHLSSIHHHAGKVFYTMNLDVLTKEIFQFITENKIKRPLIYIATDDPAFCQSYFSGKDINIITGDKLLPPDSQNEASLLMLDISALAAARMVIVSNSSFSILASLINSRAKVFLRQAPDDSLIPFDPWSTTVLLGL